MKTQIPNNETDPVICPTGLTVNVKGLTVREERILSDQKALRSGRFATALLASRASDVVAYGPYKAEGFNWRNVAQGDRFVALMAIRVATYGAEYQFSTSCPECRAKIRRAIDLTEELAIKECPPGSLKALEASEQLEAEIGGCIIKFQIPTGVDEERIAQTRGAARTPLSTSLKIRIKAVSRDGVDLKKKEVSDWLENLPLRQASEIRSAFEASEFGVDTSHSFDCEECGEIVEIDLPFGLEFWLPK